MPSPLDPHNNGDMAFGIVLKQNLRNDVTSSKLESLAPRCENSTISEGE